MAGCSERDNKRTDSIKGGEFVDHLNDYQLTR